jgi:hypothetical protein
MKVIIAYRIWLAQLFVVGYLLAHINHKKPLTVQSWVPFV